MPQYTVNHRYLSRRDGVTYGPYEPGTTVELETADAEWVNRDSPGTLSGDDIAADGETSAVDPNGEPPPVVDRAHKGGRKRS